MAYKTIDRRKAYTYLKELETGAKTPVSLAMELATKLGAVAEFEETKDLKWSNSPFKFNAKLGDVKAVGVGGSKKEAKQNSAKELIKLIENESKSYAVKGEPNSTKLFTVNLTVSLCERNVVGELQNLAAKKKWELPTYEYGEPTGEAHSKTFTCLVRMMSDLKCSGFGSSKKAAKKQAAEKMLNILQVDGDDYDMVDARTPMVQTSPYGNSTTTPETLNESDLESSSSDSEQSLSPLKLDFSTETRDLKYDNLSQDKLQSISKKEGFTIEYIRLPSKSKKGCYQVFVKLLFMAEREGEEMPPIVTHGTGNTLEIAKCKAAERACQHLEWMLSVQ
ncbi:RISC-loading complex subunit tarbp2-like [Dendronephthya gigantea]|uniref:RISC-loading complex subunit tarbp2-like n=1 Tax=Dendronephthya gigantea TaxID=151771 RepID=UPI00106C537F|nr:RISC-loading complex subunit tarbp2-like [Dendronephthya gigantea]